MTTVASRRPLFFCRVSAEKDHERRGGGGVRRIFPDQAVQNPFISTTGIGPGYFGHPLAVWRPPPKKWFANAPNKHNYKKSPPGEGAGAPIAPPPHGHGISVYFLWYANCIFVSFWRKNKLCFKYIILYFQSDTILFLNFYNIV